jgi:hypothetical protein
MWLLLRLLGTSAELLKAYDNRLVFLAVALRV